ncbi:hypothetical protein GGR42_000131 [Saonia flava]|uniref:Uncharacterized protein n=1 Tax=Saonia flava TaxID=523696 RepID=A0A846QYH6_9FLAO|nr:hypothetical protein [Saonia flava]NJB69669.1 hypothetical protein [Saonia flava]
MKTHYKNIILFFFLIISSIEMNAQYGYGGYGYGRGGYGYGGRGRSTVPQAEIPDKEPEPKTAEEIVEGEMPKITEALELSEFETAVVSSILTTSIRKRMELQILQLDQEKTKEALEKIYKTQDDDLKASLSEEKYNAFVKLQEAGFKDKKKKEKKKKKKKKT